MTGPRRLVAGWRQRLRGGSTPVGRFDLEIMLAYRGLASIPLDRMDDLHPDARAELVAFLNALAAEEERRAQRKTP